MFGYLDEDADAGGTAEGVDRAIEVPAFFAERIRAFSAAFASRAASRASRSRRALDLGLLEECSPTSFFEGGDEGAVYGAVM